MSCRFFFLFSQLTIHLTAGCNSAYLTRRPVYLIVAWVYSFVTCKKFVMIWKMLNTLTENQVALPVRLYGARLRFCECSRPVSLSFALFSKARLCLFTFTVLSPVKKRTWFICREGRYSVKDKNLTLYFISDVTKLPVGCERVFHSKTTI